MFEKSDFSHLVFFNKTKAYDLFCLIHCKMYVKYNYLFLFEFSLQNTHNTYRDGWDD